MSTPEPPDTRTPEEPAVDALHSIAYSLEVLMSVALAMLSPAKRDEAAQIIAQLRSEP
jgi:hypothetical protein